MEGYLVYCFFVCTVTDFSAAKNGRGVKFCMRVGLLSGQVFSPFDEHWLAGSHRGGGTAEGRMVAYASCKPADALVFSVNFRAAQSLTPTLCLASPNIFVFCDSSCSSSVAATMNLVHCIISCHFMCDEKSFVKFFHPSHQLMATMSSETATVGRPYITSYLLSPNVIGQTIIFSACFFLSSFFLLFFLA